MATLPLVAVVAVTALAQVQAPRPTTLFGYSRGETVHYRLGPPDALSPGEGAEWTFRFDGFQYPDDGSTIASFSFTHERFERLLGNLSPGEGVMNVVVEGRLKTNLAGFPLWVQYTQRFLIQGEQVSNNGRRTVTFTYEPERHGYRKTIKVGHRDWDFKFTVPRHKYVDLDVPRGVYMFMPGSLSCLGDARVTCVELEPALANPALLSFILPALEEMDKAERDFTFFMPTGLGASPFSLVMAGPWLSRERNRLTSLDRYFDFMKVKLGASDQVQVGPRKMHAWELDMCCGIDKIWIEPEGRVLRVDLEPTMTNPDERSIRYVFPFEDFVTPNEDPKKRCCR